MNSLSSKLANIAPITERSFGSDFMEFILSKTEDELNKQKVLILGCANESNLFGLSNVVEKITGLDDNRTLLHELKNKIKREKIKNIKIRHVKSWHTNFKEKKEGFHAVFSSVNLLDILLVHSKKALLDLISASKKVLKKKGRLILVTTSHFQLQHCYWWTHYFPETLNTILKALPTLQEILEIIISYEFSIIGIYEDTSDPPYQLDLENIETDSIKSSIPFLNYATHEEYTEAISNINKDEKENKLRDIIHSYEENLKESGLSTFIIAERQ